MIEALRGALGRAAKANRVDLALRLTLLDLLLRPVGDGAVRFLLLAIAGCGLVFPGALRAPALWWGIAALTTARVIADWPLADNHAYLLCYWCAAAAIAVSSDDTDSFLAHNGRWLIGLVFAFATLWKAVLSPDYLSGVFFQVTLLVDPRFEPFTRLVAGVPPEWIDAQRALLEQHADGGLPAAVGPALSARFLALARVATAGTLAWEGLVALAFLWPRGRGPSRLRDICLQAFCSATYAVATVEGFGWLLVAMAVAQCEPASTRTRAAYLLVFAGILFYREVPWLAFVADRWAPG